MKLSEKVKPLGPADTAALKSAVAGFSPDAWFEDTVRQDQFKNVHSATQSIVLLLCEGWPKIEVSKRAGWDRLSEYAMPIMEKIIRDHYPPGGVIHRAMVAKLTAGGVIEKHTDAHPSFAISHRIHVPLVTNDLVDFSIGDEIFHLKEDFAYEINNLERHGVENRSTVDRIHLIFDYAED